MINNDNDNNNNDNYNNIDTYSDKEDSFSLSSNPIFKIMQL